MLLWQMHDACLEGCDDASHRRRRALCQAGERVCGPPPCRRFLEAFALAADAQGLAVCGTYAIVDAAAQRVTSQHVYHTGVSLRAARGQAGRWLMLLACTALWAFIHEAKCLHLVLHMFMSLVSLERCRLIFVMGAVQTSLCNRCCSVQLTSEAPIRARRSCID